MRHRKATGVVILVLGVVLLAAAVVDHMIAAPKAALCQSGVGQIGQIFDNTVAHDCGLVTGFEAAVGWLLATGILAAILGGVLLYDVTARRGSAP
jgi:hypothetical protein